MNDSYTIDGPRPEYVVKSDKSLADKIRALEQQAAGHENIARGLRGEIAALKREAGNTHKQS